MTESLIDNCRLQARQQANDQKQSAESLITKPSPSESLKQNLIEDYKNQSNKVVTLENEIIDRDKEISRLKEVIEMTTGVDMSQFVKSASPARKTSLTGAARAFTPCTFCKIEG